MTKLGSSRISFRASSSAFLLSVVYLLLILGSVEAQIAKDAITKETNPKSLFESLKENPWANVKGFRSAKFGMDHKGVYRAIAKDFKISKSKVQKTEARDAKTSALEVTVPKLFSIGGPARVGYIFGYKSKKLMHINVIWGQGASKNVDLMEIVNTANLLRVHFLKRQYKEEGLMANGKLSENSTLVFRGRDKNNRMIAVMMNTFTPPEGEITEENKSKITLKLSYILNPDEPDIRTITIKEDEF